MTDDRAADLLRDYDAHVAQVGSLLSAHTARAYRSRVHAFMAWLCDTDIDGDPITDAAARTGAVRDYRSWLKTVKRRSPATINAHLGAIDHFYASLGLPAVSAKREMLPASAPQALSEAQQRKLLRTIEQEPSVRNRALAYTSVYTGLRIEELSRLDVADVHLSARKGRLIVRSGKGDQYREVPLHAKAREPLTRWRQARTELDLVDGAALFVNRYGTRLSTRSIHKVIAGLGRDAGFDFALTVHMLRHTFGTRLLREGVDIVLVAELMGHRSMETTRRYTLPTAADREAAIDHLLTDD